MRIFNRLLTIILISSLAIIINCSNVKAANSSIKINNKGKEDGKYILTISISGEEEIGGLEANIDFGEDMKNIEVTSSYNGWISTYNTNTGKLTSFSAAGIKNGEVVQIKYELESPISSIGIRLRGIKLTTTSYEEQNIEELYMEVNPSIDDPQKDDTKDNVEDNTKDDTNDNAKDDDTKDDNTTDNNTKDNNIKNNNNPKSNKNNKIINSSTSNLNNKTVNSTNDKTTSKTAIPNAGRNTIIAIILILIALIGTIYYIRYRNLKKYIK